MTAGSQIGYQPHPLPPIDIRKFHEHRRQVVALYQDKFFSARRQIKGLEVKKTNIKSSK